MVAGINCSVILVPSQPSVTIETCLSSIPAKVPDSNLESLALTVLDPFIASVAKALPNLGKYSYKNFRLVGTS